MDRKNRGAGNTNSQYFLNAILKAGHSKNKMAELLGVSWRTVHNISIGAIDNTSKSTLEKLFTMYCRMLCGMEIEVKSEEVNDL